MGRGGEGPESGWVGVKGSKVVGVQEVMGV